MESSRNFTVPVRLRILKMLYLILGLLLSLSRVFSEEHVLLDTTKATMLDWTRYPYGPKSPTNGWVEESFTNFEKGINW